MVPPPFTESLTASIAFSTTVLPAVWPVISIASSIGTPAEISAEKVRDQRASAIFCTMSPIFNGIFRLKAVPLHPAAVAGLPLLEADHRAARCSAIRMYHWWRDEVRGGDGDLRDRRQLAAEVLEDLLEDGHQEGDERDHHDEREA